MALPSSNDLFDLFSPNVYDGGAVVLYALRQVIGERAFVELERRWAKQNAGSSVGTDDFIALASRVAGRDLGPFLRDWVVRNGRRRRCRATRIGPCSGARTRRWPARGSRRYG